MKIKSSVLPASTVADQTLENKSQSGFGSMTITEFPIRISCSIKLSANLVLPTPVVPMISV